MTKGLRDTIEDRAIAYVLGALSPEERAAAARERLYNSALDEGIGFAERLFAGLQSGGSAPAPATRDWARIERALGEEQRALDGKHVQPCVDGDWRLHGPRVEFKPLWCDDAILIRCDPGAVEEPHDQPDGLDEHIVVVAGDLVVGGRSFGVGDYIRVPAGTIHSRMSTQAGCLLFTAYVAPAV
ncbi:cupin domain-containing protein [Sphingomonas crocodyli]|uniref:ChrR-like cupin domain-containing protein n=1 Tax=Sphingomonas crocodyli TaxID=1979270 RepID=A0A437M6U4_9SPHN|nr:cupin domain-containing protein [Sphingomonas crocodyli]RVT93313.1 hypothetical protein EOD43_05355 [Sphingomonas crocodyli]